MAIRRPAHLRLLHRLPRQWRRPAMPRHHVHAQHRVVVLVVLGPVECNKYLLSPAQHGPSPRRAQRVDVDPSVTQEPVARLDTVIWLDLRHLRVRGPARVDPHTHRTHRGLAAGPSAERGSVAWWEQSSKMFTRPYSVLILLMHGKPPPAREDSQGIPQVASPPCETNGSNPSLPSMRGARPTRFTRARVRLRG